MPSRRPSQPEQVTDLGPRVLLVASISDHVGQPNLDLTLQAGKQVHRDRGIAELVQPAKRAQRGDGLIEDRFAELVGTRADVVSTVRCCHSRIMPDTTGAVTSAAREHPKTQAHIGRTRGRARHHQQRPGIQHRPPTPSHHRLPGAKIHEDSGAKTLDDTHQVRRVAGVRGPFAKSGKRVRLRGLVAQV